MNEIQNKEFSILKKFKKYCDKKSLNFFLIGGTLLGAVRHKGFIPWDDDIDVGMKREDYNKLIEFAKENEYIDSNKRYKILLPLEENYVYPYIKIVDTYTLVYEKFLKKEYAHGVWVDVFPYDYGADTYRELLLLNKKQKFYKLFLKIGISGELPFKKKILKVIAYPFYAVLTRGNYKYWVKKILRLPTAHKTNYIGNVVWSNSEKDIFPVEWFHKTTELSFEGENFCVPICYHEYLKHFYGDYMKLPDEKDRVIHDFEYYYLGKK